jgi:hypothetical protein
MDLHPLALPVALKRKRGICLREELFRFKGVFLFSLERSLYMEIFAWRVSNLFGGFLHKSTRGGVKAE